MAEVIKQLPDQIQTACMINIPKTPKGSFKRVIVGGMGGSVIPIDVMADAFAEKIQKPISVIRNYDSSIDPDDKTLFVIISFSGDTEETISFFNRVSKVTNNVVVISGGGQLSSIANERNICLIHIPKERHPSTFQPRSALGYIFTLFTRLLFKVKLIENPLVELEAIPEYLRKTNIRQDAEIVARWLSDKIPVIYTDENHLMSIARVAKIKFNENSKRPAFFNALPEVNHNEMIGFSSPLANFGILYFHDSNSNPRILQRYNTMKAVFNNKRFENVDFYKWEIPGNTRLKKIMSAISFTDWCSYSLALLNKIDPTPIKLIEDFKHHLETLSGI